MVNPWPWSPANLKGCRMETDGDTLESLRAQLEDTRRAQAGQDRKNAELQAEIKRLQSDLAKYKNYGGGEDQVRARLERIEGAYKQKEKDLEIRYHLRERCLDTGLDPVLFDGIAFQSREQIDATITRWAELQDTLVDRAVNSRLVAGEKPRAGGDPRPQGMTVESAFRDVIARELKGVRS